MMKASSHVMVAPKFRQEKPRGRRSRTLVSNRGIRLYRERQTAMRIKRMTKEKELSPEGKVKDHG